MTGPWHPALSKVFTELDRTEVVWALLRMPRDPQGGTGDLDMLIRQSDVPTMRKVTRDIGFVAVPGWSDPPNVVLLLYDRRSRCWLTLDILTELSFGPEAAFQTAAETQVLQRRERRDGVWRLAPADEFWTTLLHCWIEKDAFREDHRASMLRLAPHADTGSVLARATEKVSSMTAAEIVGTVSRRDWSSISNGSTTSWRHRTWRSRIRQMRRIYPVVFRRRGVSVALLGANGSGKSSVAASLVEHLPLRTIGVYMGLWGGTGLSHRLGPLAAVARPIEAWAKGGWAAAFQLLGQSVVYDRYPYEALISWAAGRSAPKRWYMALLSRTCPRPDIIVVLDLAAARAHERKPENSLRETEYEVESYRWLAKQVNAHLIDGDRPLEQVTADVSDLVWQRYRRRWNPFLPVRRRKPPVSASRA